MGTHYGTNQVIRVFGMFYPVADRFIGGILERAIAAGGRDHRCAQHFHAGHIGSLTGNVGFAHIHNALQPHQGANGRSGYSVLASTSLRDDAVLAHFLRQKDLADGIVDFVRPGMTQILSF